MPAAEIERAKQAASTWLAAHSEVEPNLR